MTAGLKAQLELSADASGVETGITKAKRSLADLGAAATAAGKDASAGLAKAGDGGGAASTKIDAATRNIIGSIQRTTAALDAGGRSSSDYFKLLASQRGIDAGVLAPYLTQLDAVAAKQKLATSAITAGAKPLESYAMSARATAAALRQVPAQFTDIVTSLQGGQRPLTVLLQQGGQLKDVFGGIGPAARALGGYILGLVNPFTIAAAAIAAVTYAAFKGSDEIAAYAKALILSGNASGATVGELNEMAKAISAVAGTQGNAAAALAQFAESSNIGAESLQKFTQAAIVFERATGQSIDATVKQFAALGKDPVDASVKLNESMNYLTLSTYSQIKAAEDQGRATDAAKLAQTAYADAIESRGTAIEARLGTIERLWKGIKKATLEAADAALNIGRGSSLQDQVGVAQKELDAREQRGPLNPLTTAAYEKGNQALRDRIATLKESIRIDDSAASSTAAAARQVQARIAFDKDGAQFATNAAKAEKEVTKARNEGAAAGATQVEIEKRVADIRAKYADKGGARVSLGIDKSQLNLDIAALQKSSDQLGRIFTNQEKVLEAQHSAGIMSDADYFNQKRGLIEAETQIAEYALEKQIKRYEKEKLNGKDAIDNQKKIADTESKLAIVREDAAAKLEVISVQQKAAADRLALSFLTARQAAQDYFESIQKQQARDLVGFGQGTQARGRDAGVNQIEDRYAGQRRDLENTKAQLELEGKFTTDARAQYDERLRIITEFQDKSISSYLAYYDRREQLEMDASIGAQEATQNYIDQASKVGKLTEQAYTNAFSSIEDALVQFVTTGKLNFKSLANSIIADFVRIEIKAAQAKVLEAVQGVGGFAGLLGLFGGAGASAGGFDAGTTFSSVTTAATGINYVPRDNMPFILHKGEAVVPAAYNPSAGAPMKISIINQTRATISDVQEVQVSPTERALIIQEAVSQSAAQHYDPNSAHAQAMKRNYRTERNR